MEDTTNINTSSHYPYPVGAEFIEINNPDLWVKVVAFLQHNWAVIEEKEIGQFKILFFGDLSEVFDELDFESLNEAMEALLRNGFGRWDEENERFKEGIPKPKLPLYINKRVAPSNKGVYSSGRYWI